MARVTDMNDCIFCAIVAGDAPATIIDSDERTVSFLDINPATEGHLLVIPREHSRDLGEITAEDLAACSLTAQRMAKKAVADLGADGVNLLNCWGEVAWQTVFHFHLHVVPRYTDDRDRLELPWIPAAAAPGILESAATAYGSGS